MDWSAARYTLFEHERSRPARDLLNAVPADLDVRSAVDLGCGPGNSTALLRERFPDARLVGLDSAPDMLAAARARLPDVALLRADIAEWARDGASADAERFDLLFSNAALQWVPDHAALLPSLLQRLRPGGVFAMQVPDNLEEPAQTLMRTVAADGRWANKLAGAAGRREPRRPPHWFDALARAGGAEVEVWRTTYHHRIPDGSNGVVRWFESTGLQPFLEPLDAGERTAFLADYTAMLAHAYPASADGAVLLPFPRLFVVARMHDA